MDFKNGVVRLEPGETKNNEGRTLYMDSEIQALMKSLYRKREFGCDYVFHIEGRHINDFRKAWKSACEKVGIPGMLFHDLRRTAVRNMVRAGIPERVAMTLSGHKTRSVFDRYNIVSQDDLKEAALRNEEYRRHNDEASRLQNGYNRPKSRKKVVTLRATTP